MRSKIISAVAILMFYVFLYWVWLGNAEQIYKPEATNGWGVFGAAISILLTFYGLGYLCFLCIKWVIK